MELCLITCNIRFDNPADGDNSWSHRRLFLSKTLLKHSADVIATQEGRFDQLKDLEKILPGYVLLDQHRSWIKERMYPALFLKINRFETRFSGDLWLSDTPEIAGSQSFDSAFPRLMTWANVQIKDSSQKITLINTHLDHIQQETRISQARVLALETKKLWVDDSKIFIMGDFNDDPSSEVRKIINDQFSGLQDAWALKNSVEESSHHGFKGPIKNGSRIDWILADKRVTVESCVLDKTSKNNRYPSDHFPVVSRVSF